MQLKSLLICRAGTTINDVGVQTSRAWAESLLENDVLAEEGKEERESAVLYKRVKVKQSKKGPPDHAYTSFTLTSRPRASAHSLWW
jgi:hypothetical protein